ncbi:geranylgeranylglyceryl phosphate synthase [Methanocaldococcus vulcanius M7]|uniref:Geranylgeranylglyceryl phosphate synthase n=1 Tax=Methanocaldococcus vulcanius (strain ATCC 700851 / DSM 12094 / M7) TaxID=579137 RepID=C9RGR5_METVM|nr:geranylgeranylglyceryl/heptaprenylglyceryl phosphate synthase [Methanocaldococcus vulcanius]ACX72767.1 geranylgeranylglyceryl phosphate synthase [Methanocaldococcus vulcanius M7]
MDIKIGKVEKKLNQIIEDEGAVYLTLLDPEEENIEEIAENIKDYADAVMIGGSVGVVNLDNTVKKVKKITNLPIILFPGNVDGLSRYADAVFYMSLMNSLNTYWAITAPTLGSITILKYNLEPIPMAYLCIEPARKTAVGYVGEIREIPQNKPKITAMYCLSAKFFGMRWAYLEAGSGAEYPVNNETISMAKKLSDINLIVGGGIRKPEIAYEKVLAGADVIVTGNLLEEDVKAVEMMYDYIKKAGREKLKN